MVRAWYLAPLVHAITWAQCIDSVWTARKSKHRSIFFRVYIDSVWCSWKKRPNPKGKYPLRRSAFISKLTDCELMRPISCCGRRASALDAEIYREKVGAIEEKEEIKKNLRHRQRKVMELLIGVTDIEDRLQASQERRRSLKRPRADSFCFDSGTDNVTGDDVT